MCCFWVFVCLTGLAFGWLVVYFGVLGVLFVFAVVGASYVLDEVLPLSHFLSHFIVKLHLLQVLFMITH